MDFLSFSSTPPLSPSFSCPHTIILISIHGHTTSNYFHVLVGYFSHLRCPSNSFILSSLVIPLSHLNTLISATYCDFFTAHVHWFLLGLSLLYTYRVLSLHNYLAVSSSYCASRLLDVALYRTPALFLHKLPHREYCIRHPPLSLSLSIWDKSKLCVPKPSLNNHVTHIQCISALSICNSHTPGCLTHQSIGTVRLSLHSVDILSCSYTLSMILITCQYLLFPNTSTHPIESHPFPLSLLSSFVITLLFSTSSLQFHCCIPSFGTPSSETDMCFPPFSSLSKYPFHLPMILSRSQRRVLRPLSDCSW